MTYEQAKRRYLVGKFERLAVGQFEELDRLSNDQLEDLVDELENAQRRGLLNLETEQGLTNLQEIIDDVLAT